MQIALFDEYNFIKNIGLTDYMFDNLDNLLLFVKDKDISIFMNTTFEFILNLDPHQRGKFGELFIETLAKDVGFYVEKSIGGDRMINGVDVEIKFARQKEDGGFIINQISWNVNNFFHKFS